jgi:hypothetical protein
MWMAVEMWIGWFRKPMTNRRSPQRLDGPVMAALFSMALGGCMATAPEPLMVPIAGWSRPLCLPNAVAVRSPWDAEVTAIFARLLRVAGDEVRDRNPVAVVVEGEGLPTAGVCGGPGVPSTVVLPARTLRAAWSWPIETRQTIIATQLAHELAHVALHQERGVGVPRAVKEAEADALAAYYLERAGFDCQRWVAGIGGWYRANDAAEAAQRPAIEAACARAKRGERPPLPAR